MFGWGTATVVTATQLVVTHRFNVLLLAILLIGTALGLIYRLADEQGTTGKWILFGTLATLAWALLPSYSRLTLDRTTQRASLREYVLLHFSTESFPLDAVDGATLRTGSASEQIQLNLAGGGFRLLSYKDGFGGKEKAIYEINRFVGDGATQYKTQ